MLSRKPVTFGFKVDLRLQFYLRKLTCTNQICANIWTCINRYLNPNLICTSVACVNSGTACLQKKKLWLARIQTLYTTIWGCASILAIFIRVKLIYWTLRFFFQKFLCKRISLLNRVVFWFFFWILIVWLNLLSIGS